MRHREVVLSRADCAALRVAYMACQRGELRGARGVSKGDSLGIRLSGGPLDGLVSVEWPELRTSEFVAYCRSLSVGLVQVFYRRGDGCRVFEACQLME